MTETTPFRQISSTASRSRTDRRGRRRRISGRFNHHDVFDAGPGRDIADFSWTFELQLLWDESGDGHVLDSLDVFKNVEVAIMTDWGDTVMQKETRPAKRGSATTSTSSRWSISPRSCPRGPDHPRRPGIDSIRFDVAPDFSTFVELSRDTLGGSWPATYDGFEFILVGPTDDEFQVEHPDAYPRIVGEGGHDTLALHFAVEGMKVTMGQSPLGDGPWLRAFDFELVSATRHDDVILEPGPREGGAGRILGLEGNDFLRGGDFTIPQRRSWCGYGLGSRWCRQPARLVRR